MAFQRQARLAAKGRRAVLVARQFGHFVQRVQRAFLQQAMQQEDIQETHGGSGDARGHKRIQVHAAHFDVFDAALQQRVQRPLAAVDDPLGADRAVELVFDLQQRGGELVVFAAQVLDADGFVGWVGLRQCGFQRAGVGLQAVVADGQARLRIALVAQPAHAQAGGVGQVQGVFAQALQAVFAPGHETVAHRGAGAKQPQQQESVAAEVADQRKVLFVGEPRQRPVVVDAANRLHAPAIAVRQAHAVHTLGAADVAVAVAAQRDVLVGRQAAGHAGHPELFAPFRGQRAVDELVGVGELVHAILHAGVNAGDQLQLAFAVIGGDVRVRQRRAQGQRMWRQRQAAATGQGAQAFLFDATADAEQSLGGQAAQTFGQGHSGSRVTGAGAEGYAFGAQRA